MNEISKKSKSVKKCGKRSKTVFIDDPKALPGASFFSLIAIGLHYIILAYLFLSGRFYNKYRAPTYLFVIPTFIVAGSTAVGLLCFLLQSNSLVRRLCEPSTGLPLAIVGAFSGSAYCFVVYGTLDGDFFQGYQLLETGILITIYYLLVGRRLAFARIAFTESATAVSQLNILWFRTLIFSLVLLSYVCGWCLLYIQLVEDPDLISKQSEGNSTAVQPSYIPIPQWIMFVNSQLPVSKPGLRSAGKAFLVYNLVVVSQAVKVSLWMSVCSIVSAASDCIHSGSKLRVQPFSELTDSIWQSLPSILFAGHALLLSQVIESAAEALRRCNARRAGITHGLGSLLLYLSRPLLSRCNIYGVCRAQRSGRNIARSSVEATRALSRCGLRDAANGDLLCGARICGCLLLSCAGSVAGSTLVTIFGFPPSVSHEIELLCFLTVFLVGNWGAECAEVWACALTLEFADAPEAVYAAAPRLATGLHAVLFGCGRPPLPETARRVRRLCNTALLRRALGAWWELGPAASSACLQSPVGSGASGAACRNGPRGDPDVCWGSTAGYDALEPGSPVAAAVGSAGPLQGPKDSRLCRGGGDSEDMDCVAESLWP